jgi:uncharacterized lipoprotein YmbA
MRKKQITGLFLGTACACLLAGCANTQQSKLYVLHSPPTVMNRMAFDVKLQKAKIEIGRIRLPKHLDRPAIMTQINDSELRYSEFRRWAGPLDSDLTRVISMNLSQLLGSSNVTGSRATLSTEHDYRIDIEILSMTGMLGKEATLVTRWRVSESGPETHGEIRTTRYRTVLKEKTDYDAYVAAQSEMVMKLSKDISEALKKKAGAK